jgi:hypothetical protein
MLCKLFALHCFLNNERAHVFITGTVHAFYWFLICESMDTGSEERKGWLYTHINMRMCLYTRISPQTPRHRNKSKLHHSYKINTLQASRRTRHKIKGLWITNMSPAYQGVGKGLWPPYLLQHSLWTALQWSLTTILSKLWTKRRRE